MEKVKYNISSIILVLCSRIVCPKISDTHGNLECDITGIFTQRKKIIQGVMPGKQSPVLSTKGMD